MNAKMTKQKNHQSFRKGGAVARQISPCRLDGKNQESKYDSNCTFPTSVYVGDMKNMNM
jgi:hypothetical protein